MSESPPRSGDIEQEQRKRDSEDARDPNDHARLADEARDNVVKAAAELRAQRVPIETEPPTIYRPS